jgi:hypothetical protein
MCLADVLLFIIIITLFADKVKKIVGKTRILQSALVTLKQLLIHVLKQVHVFLNKKSPSGKCEQELRCDLGNKTITTQQCVLSLVSIS